MVGNKQDIQNEIEAVKKWYFAGLLDAAEYYLMLTKLESFLRG